MRVVESSIGTVLEQIIKQQTGLGMSCAECKDDIETLNSMAPCDVLATIHKHAGRIVNRAMSRKQPWYIRLTSQHLPKFATAVVSDWIKEACETCGPINETWEPDPIDETSLRASLVAGPLPIMIPRVGRFAGRCIAVTSLDPNPVKAARQIQCVQSWNTIGLDTIAVNTRDEIESMSDQLVSMVKVVVSDKTASRFSRRTQKISSLLAAGIASETSFAIINADVELYGDSVAIETALSTPHQLTLGIRWNHSRKAGRESARIERHGIDALFLTPQLAAQIPDTEFCIGMPAWDYFIPCHLKSKGYRVNWITEPLLFHEEHPIGWSHDDWAVGAAIMRDRYGIDISSTSPTVREQLKS